MRKLNIITSFTKDGIMSNDRKYFKNLTKTERDLLYNKTLERFLQKINISTNKCIILNKDNNEYGYKLIGKNKKLNTKKEVIVMKSTTPNFFVGAETVDEPVIIASVTKNRETVCAIGLGSLENLKNELLDKMVGYLINESGCTPFEITFYISATLKPENVIIKDKEFINSRVLKEGITKENDGYHLDIKLAIFKDLYNQLVDPKLIYFSSDNPITDNRYFTNVGNRAGKNIIGVFFQDEV